MKYISSVETAKIIRQILREKFPGVKFSVKTRSTGSIRIKWTDGPKANLVESAVSYLSGKGFDGMIDMEYYYRHYQLPDGRIIYGGTSGTEGSMGVVSGYNVTLPEGAEEVNIGVSYIFTDREMSPRRWEESLKFLRGRYDIPDDIHIKVFESGRAYLSANPTIDGFNDLHRLMCEVMHGTRWG